MDELSVFGISDTRFRNNSYLHFGRSLSIHILEDSFVLYVFKTALGQHSPITKFPGVEKEFIV